MLLVKIVTNPGDYLSSESHTTTSVCPALEVIEFLELSVMFFECLPKSGCYIGKNTRKLNEIPSLPAKTIDFCCGGGGGGGWCLALVLSSKYCFSLRMNQPSLSSSPSLAGIKLIP